MDVLFNLIRPKYEQYMSIGKEYKYSLVLGNTKWFYDFIILLEIRLYYIKKWQVDVKFYSLIKYFKTSNIAC